MKLNKIIKNCELETVCENPELIVEVTGIIKELFVGIKTKEKIENMNCRHVQYALKNFAIANTKSQIQKPKQYFKQCLLSALEQIELSSQYDTQTIYQEENDIYAQN